MNPHLLGVERSFLARGWHDRLDDAGFARALAMVQRYGLPDLLARSLAGRGVSLDDCEAFLRPSLRATMPDPDCLAAMPACVDRLARAVEHREQIAIFGDYDVDGAASAALLGRFLRACGLDPLIHIPDRITEGYGPNEAAIATLAGRGATLLVTVDCGSTSTAPLAAAKRCGLETLIIDHHRATADLPDAVAVVNPNRLDDLSGLGHLCAAGVVYMVLVALHRRLRQRGFWSAKTPPDLLESLDLVALATVADVVPLTGLNRAFVSKGLALMRERSRPGLRALFDAAGADGPPTAFHLGFLIGPRINAGGRIGDAGLGTRLLMTDDADEATRIAADLDRLNRERRVVELAAVAEAEAEALLQIESGRHAGGAILCANPAWHPGVLGLVASRLKERFGMPAFALAIDGDKAVGSGRSIPGVDLGALVLSAVEQGLLIKGGGHAMAAGITVAADRIEAFRRFADDALAAAVTLAQADRGLKIDATVAARAISVDLVTALEGAGPFGAAHPEIVVAVPNLVVRSAQVVGGDHLRLTAEAADGTRVTAVTFRAAGSPFGRDLQNTAGRPVHLVGSLILNRWGGGAGRPELRLLDAAYATHRRDTASLAAESAMSNTS